jgi:hypothetical protein
MIRVLLTAQDHQVLDNLLRYIIFVDHYDDQDAPLARQAARMREVIGNPLSVPARRSDPDTSHAAAAAIPTDSRAHREILRVLENASPVTDEQLADQLADLSPSRVRTARNDLVRAGKIVRHPEDGRTRSGRKAARWMPA